MKTYTYFYNKEPIQKSQFLSVVPKNWENDIKDGEYSNGNYKASEMLID